MQSTATEPSVSEMLASLGYGHRKVGDHPFAHIVFDLATGERIGLMSACGAAEFCHEQERLRAETATKQHS